MVKYVLYPGYVRSKHDEELHYVSSYDLIRLYNVNPKECITAPRDPLAWEDTGHLITLEPKFNGDYTLPTK